MHFHSAVSRQRREPTDGSYSVVTRGLPIAYYDLSAQVTITTGAYTSASPLLFTPAMPTLTSGVVAGTVSGTIMETTPGTYDSGYLVISRFANIIDTQNIGAALAATNGGTYGDTLPAGTASYPVPGAYYYGYLWVWNSAHPLFTLKVVPINGMMDLRNTNSVAGMNVTLP